MHTALAKNKKGAGRPAADKQYHIAAPMRRFLFYIYKNLVFDPLFDMAITYHDAIQFSQKEKTLLARPWNENDRKAPLAEIHGRLQNMEERDGPDAVSRMGILMSEITACSAVAVDKSRLNVHTTHLLFDADRGRHPTINELRLWTWYLTTPHGKKHFGGHFVESEIPNPLLNEWKQGGPGPGARMDRGQFGRLVKQMKLPLFPSQLLRALRRRFDSLQRKLGRKPSEKEFLSGVEHYTRDACQLASCTLDELVRYLSSFHAPCNNARWHCLDVTRNFLGEAMKLQMQPPVIIKNARALVETLARLDIALEPERLAPIFEAASLPRPTLHEVMGALASRQTKFPGISDILTHTEHSKLVLITKELRFSKLHRERLLALSEAMKSNGESPPSTLDEIGSFSSDIKAISLALKEHYKTRLPGFIWFELSKEILSPPCDYYSPIKVTDRKG